MIALATLSLLVPAAPPLQSEQTARPTLRRFEVVPTRSEVGFDGTSSLHDFTGRTHDVSGVLWMDPAAPDRYSAGRMECRAATLDTDNDARDEKMREHLDVEHYPVIAFDLARAMGPAQTTGTEFAGAFSIHGVQRDYHVQAPLVVDETGHLHVKGRVPLRLRDHGIVPPAVLVVEVGEEVQVWFDLELAPAAGAAVPARAFPLVVHERLEAAGGGATESDAREQLFVAEGGVLWERPESGTWIVGGPRGTRAVDVATGRAAPPAVSADASFSEARATMQRLEDKLARLEGVKRERAEAAVASTLAQLRGVLAHAPAAGPAERVALDDGTAWRIGDVTWLEIHGARGDGALAPLLASFEGVPESIRSVLATIEGVPARVELRCATMGGVRTLELEVAEAGAGEVPASAFASAATAPVGEVSR